MASRRARYERSESEAHKLDRNYSELLQELRVAETGVQILFAFLLGIAFQQRFSSIGGFDRTIYLVTLGSAAMSVALLIAPVAIHRVLFHRRRKDELVAATSRLAGFGLVFLSLAMLGAVLLIFDFVADRWLAVGITVVLGVTFGYTWVLLPLRLTETGPSLDTGVGLPAIPAGDLSHSRADIGQVDQRRDGGDEGEEADRVGDR